MKLSLPFFIIIASAQGFAPGEFGYRSSKSGAVSSAKIVPKTYPFTTTKMPHFSSSSSSSSSTQLMYGNDPPRDQSSEQKLKSGFWNALSHTEEWMSNTLKSSANNPLVRNEVSYECEMNPGILSCITGIFRRYREARQLGQRYERIQKEMAAEDPFYEIEPLRRTQVMILPFCEYFDTFETFEEVIQAILSARQIALDLITDVAVEKLERESSGLMKEKDWDVKVSGASLHPDYSYATAEEVKRMEGDGDMTEKQKQMLEKKNRARRSPYPTLIVEVKAEPALTKKTIRFEGDGMDDIVKKLESIYAMSAALHKKSESTQEDIFYNAIGAIDGIEEFVTVDIAGNVEEWIKKNDKRFDPNLSSFTSSNLRHADSAYEFVFTNIAMHKFDPVFSKSKSRKQIEYKPGARSYFILPKFVTSSATSFEKFADGIRGIVRSVAGLEERIAVSVMHPEHVEAKNRSPAPVLVMQWYDEK